MTIWTPLLRAHVDGRHLTDDAVQGYADTFKSHPARLVLLRGFLLDAVADRLSRFLACEAEFRVEFGLYSTEDPVSEEEWAEADEADRFFRVGKLAGADPKFRMSANALSYLRFRHAFQDPGLREFFESLSGLPLGPSDDFGAHAMGTGDYLRPHSDDNRNRRLALVLYLSRGWQPTFGGELRVRGGSGEITVIVPEYNSLVAFDVLAATTHAVAPVRAEAGEAIRLSIGGWYHRVG